MWKGSPTSATQSRACHKRSPSPTALMNHSLQVEFGPFRFTYSISSLPNKTNFSPIPSGKAWAKNIRRNLSRDFSCISNSEQLKKSRGWGMNLYCRPLESWYTLEGEHCPKLSGCWLGGSNEKRGHRGKAKKKTTGKENGREGQLSIGRKSC